jgi:phosphate transport system substrate-binding protein
MMRCLLGIVLFLLMSPWGAYGQEAAEIAVIVNKDNQTGSLRLGDLARIYRGERGEWPDDGRIVATNHAVESELRRRFYDSVLGVPPTEKFLVPGTPLPFHTMIFKSPKVVLRFVASTPHAIGYVPADQVDSSVKVLRIDGLLPDQARYPIK